MNEYLLINELQNLYGMNEEDAKFSFDGEKPNEHPRVLTINGRKIGCMSIKKPANTESGWVQLAYFRTYETNSGVGSRILSELCALADRYKVSIFLDAVPQGNGSETISRSKLVAWYRRYGFEGEHYMEREPNN